MTIEPYSLHKIATVCAHLGLTVDYDKIREIEPSFKDAGITQKQFDLIVVTHAEIVNDLFTPSNFTWWSRITIALYFLGIIRK